MLRLVRWPLFRELTKETFDAITGPMRLESHASGRLLLLDGQGCATLYVVARGYTVHSQLSPEGREHVLSYPGPGRLLNLVTVLDGLPQAGNVTAATDVDLYALPADVFLEAVRTRPDLGLAVARQLARDNRALVEMARGLALDPVRKRLAAFLIEWAEHAPPQHRWTQDLIAARIGTVRDVVGRALRDLEQQGLVRRHRGQLVIVDRERLLIEAGISDI